MQNVFEEIIEKLEEKIKVTSLEIIVTGTKAKPYFEIRYKEVGKKDYSIGYSSYDLNNVFEWKEESFEIVNQVAEECKSTEHVNRSTNEVCEWSKMKNTQGYMRAKQHNNAEPNYKIRVWKFCPYCSRKIKVVE